MATKELNLGILAHVDAGKTTLTERLLYEAGAIDELGSVDAGTTQTDSLTLEQQRGITIRSAVASFPLGDVHVNLIDTPGHPDFIAEVERVLSVLDGAVLVISGVEGVQPQTRLLMRALQRLRIPTLVFVNKIDRAGAGDERVLQDISERLTTAVVPMGAAARARHARRLLHALERGGPRLPGPAGRGARRTRRGNPGGVRRGRVGRLVRPLRDALAAQTKRALVHPVFFGSAVTGAGVESLMTGIAELLPASAGDPDGPVSGTVFKIERAPNGEKIAYVRMFSGTIRHARPAALRPRPRGQGDRDHASSSAGSPSSVRPSPQAPSQSSGASREIQIGDRIGETGIDAAAASVRAADTGVGRRRGATTTTARGSASRSRSSPSRTR